MLKSSSQFAGVSYNEEKVREGLRTPDGKHPLVEPMGWRNFPAPEGMLLTERAIIQTMKDWCVGGHVRKNFQLHFVVSCRGNEKSPEELKAAAEHLLDRFGYGKCPTVFYLHRDTDDLHLHVVTTTVDERGKKIPDHQNALHFAQELDEYQRVDVDKEVDDAVRKAMGYHFTSDRQFSLLLSSLGFQNGHRYEKDESERATTTPRKESKSIWATNALWLFLYRYEKVVGRISMEQIRRKAEENKRKVIQDANREKCREKLAKKMMECRLREMEDFYSGRKPLTKKELKRVQKVRALDSQLEGAMARRGIMRNDLYQMALAKDEMKKMGVDIRYNYDRNGIPNGFIVIDHGSRSVWKGSELGFSFAKFLRPDEPRLWRIVQEGRYREYMSAVTELRERGEHIPVVLQVRNRDGGLTHFVYGEENVSMVPEGVGRETVVNGVPLLFLTGEDMDTLKGKGFEFHVKESMYDAIPREDLLDDGMEKEKAKTKGKEQPEGAGGNLANRIPEGFIKASGPIVRDGAFYIMVDEIGGRPPRNRMCQISREDWVKVKNGEMSLEDAVAKYCRKEVVAALEDYFDGQCYGHGVSIDIPDFGAVLDKMDISQVFGFINHVVDCASTIATDLGDAPSSGIPYGGISRKDVSKKKRKKDKESQGGGVSY